MFAERNASMSRYTRYKPNKASSGLKHWRIHEQQLVDGITVNSGCNSTLTNNGFVLAAKNTKDTEASYSYACLDLQTASRL